MEEFLKQAGNGTVNTAIKDGSGNSLVIWILLIVITALVAFILIRDKRARQWVTSIFRKAKNRIKKARINSKIDKLNEDVREIVVGLGKKVWERHLLPEKSENVRRLISESLKRKAGYDSGMEEINEKLEKNAKELEGSEKDKDKQIKDLNEKKAPHDREFRDKKDKHSDLEKRKRTLEKNISRLNKSIEKEEKTLAGIKSDKLLDEEERNFRLKRSEDALKAAKLELTNNVNELPDLEVRLTDLSKEISSAESEIKKYEKEIDKIEDGFKEIQKKAEEIKKGLMSEKAKVAANLNEVKKRLESDFFLLGDLADKIRPDDNSLTKLYQEIDSGRGTIKNLKKELEQLR